MWCLTSVDDSLEVLFGFMEWRENNKCSQRDVIPASCFTKSDIITASFFLLKVSIQWISNGRRESPKHLGEFPRKDSEVKSVKEDRLKFCAMGNKLSGPKKVFRFSRPYSSSVSCCDCVYKGWAPGDIWDGDIYNNHKDTSLLKRKKLKIKYEVD